MKIHNFPQGSEQWEKARRGRPTASRFSEIITAVKCDLSASWRPYALELIAECFETDLTSGFSGNKNTDRGHVWEPVARAAFIKQTGFDVREVGFVTQDNGIIGCSPDGLIYQDGVEVSGLEIKCLLPKEHVKIIESGKFPDAHKQQVHGSLYVTGLPEWHFWSYCPGMRPFHCVVKRDAYTEKLGAALEEFVIQYAALRNELLPKLRLPEAA